MADRDDFPARTKQALAMRAGHVCSMPGCGQRTVGPSEETPESWSMIGVAAHISAAAPGGPRYDAALSPAQRKEIGNGIWLCRNCATHIDNDTARFTVTGLREMKLVHEANQSFGPKGCTDPAADDLIGLGPSIICSGELLGADANGHELLIKHFVAGEPSALFSFVNEFGSLARDDRYVLINELGEGFRLRGAPALRREGLTFRLTVPLAPRALRTSVHALGSSFAQDETGDWFAEDGDVALVSGLAAFPQNLSNSSGLGPWGSPFHPTAGSRIGEYFRDFNGSAWLERLIKMEVIRLASIPAADQVLKDTSTPLRCVDRVHAVEIPSLQQVKQRLLTRMTLDVCGYGKWENDVRLFIHTPEQLAKAGAVPDWLAEAMAGQQP